MRNNCEVDSELDGTGFTNPNIALDENTKRNTAKREVYPLANND